MLRVQTKNLQPQLYKQSVDAHQTLLMLQIHVLQAWLDYCQIEMVAVSSILPQLILNFVIHVAYINICIHIFLSYINVYIFVCVGGRQPAALSPLSCGSLSLPICHRDSAL